MIGFDSCNGRFGRNLFKLWVAYSLVSKNYSQFRTCISSHASTNKEENNFRNGPLINHCNANVEDIENHA